MKNFALLGLACAFLASPASAQSTSVSIAYVPAVDFLPAIVAKENGCFESKRIAATLSLIPVATNIPAGLLANSIQIGMSTASILLPAAANGLDLVAIAGASRSLKGRETVSLMTQPDLVVSKPSDLIGKKIGVPGLLSIGDLVLRRWLVDGGVSVNQVQFVELSFARMMEALSSKVVDAVIAAEPVRTLITSKNVGRRSDVEFYSAVIPDANMSLWMATGDWARKNPALVHGFRECIEAAPAWIAQNAGRAKDLETQYFKYTAPNYPTWSTEIAARDFDVYVALGKQFGLLTELVDTRKLIFKP